MLSLFDLQLKEVEFHVADIEVFSIYLVRISSLISVVDTGVPYRSAKSAAVRIHLEGKYSFRQYLAYLILLILFFVHVLLSPSSNE